MSVCVSVRLSMCLSVCVFGVCVLRHLWCVHVVHSPRRLPGQRVVTRPECPNLRFGLGGSCHPGFQLSPTRRQRLSVGLPLSCGGLCRYGALDCQLDESLSSGQVMAQATFCPLSPSFPCLLFGGKDRRRGRMRWRTQPLAKALGFFKGGGPLSGQLGRQRLTVL